LYDAGAANDRAQKGEYPKFVHTVGDMLEAIRVISEQMAMINVDHWKFPIHARAIGANSINIFVG